jgi:hypothetical protein
MTLTICNARRISVLKYSRVMNKMDLFCLEINSRIEAPCGPNSQCQLLNSFELTHFFLVRAASFFTLKNRCANKLTRYKEEGIHCTA